ncbi:hypothetical protein ACWEDF_10345 [Micromonospora chersina]
MAHLLTRRTLLGAAAGVAGAAVVGGLAARQLAEPRPGPAPAVPDAPAGDERLIRIRSGARDREVDFWTAVPEGYGDGRGLPVCLVLHGASATPRDYGRFGLARFLTDAVRRGAPPFALAGATGGRLSWRRSGDDDPQRMVREELPTWCARRGFAAVLAGVVGAAAWTATQRVAAMDTTKQPTSGAWVGNSVTGPLGVPLRENAFEFTVYRLACGGGTQPASPSGGRQCLATVGVRNVTSGEQTWHGQLQRAYLPGGNWVATDESATRVANLGRDVFAQPVAAGSRVLLPLVFTVHGDDPPKQLELRSGVFSAGVRVDVR